MFAHRSQPGGRARDHRAGMNHDEILNPPLCRKTSQPIQPLGPEQLPRGPGRLFEEYVKEPPKFGHSRFLFGAHFRFP